MERHPSTWYREYDLNLARRRGYGLVPSPHQTRALQELNRWFDFTTEGSRGGILVLPTGAGKTFTASRFLCTQPISKGQKVLWLAHTHHLLEQAFLSFDDPISHIKEPKNELSVRVVSGTASHFRVHAIKPQDDVVICSIQTAARALANRHPNFMQFLAAASGGLFVVFDEAHHAPAPTYRRFLFDLNNHCQSGGLLGLTATPTYTDEKKRGWLRRVFPQGIVHQEEPARLMAAGILSQPILETAKTSVEPEFDDREYANWISTYRDLPEKIIQNLAENRFRNNFIADYYANNRARFGKTIIFADRWYQCDQIRESLIRRGVRADVVYSHVDGVACPFFLYQAL